jgi:RimJ/RimL family protein N-acetyltransferase
MVDLKMISNSPEYYEFIRELRTDPKNIGGFVEQVSITTEQQKKYMEKYSECYQICLLNDEPVGFIGVVDKDIRFAVKPNHHGQGIGKFMMKELIKTNSDVLAKVMINNVASSKVFESCNFKLYKKDEQFLYYKL